MKFYAKNNFFGSGLRRALVLYKRNAVKMIFDCIRKKRMNPNRQPIQVFDLGSNWCTVRATADKIKGSNSFLAQSAVL